MRTHAWTALGLMALLVAACSDNPPLGVDEHDEELTVELTIEPGHAHTLAPVTFRAIVRDGHGDVVTGFDTLRVERLSSGTTTWRTAADLTLAGTAYEGEATFVSSGGYELRVMGQRPGHSMEEIHTAGHMEPINIGRAHFVESGMRVEFESFPGHIHEGDAVEMKFWVLESEPNAEGVRPPMQGLTAEITCVEVGFTESHQAMEHEPGVYEATHVFGNGGEGQARITISTASGPVLAEFPLNVAHKH